MSATVGGQRCLVCRREIPPAINDVAGGGHVEAAQDVQKGGLARTRRAEQYDEFTRREIEVDTAQGFHSNLAHLVHLRESTCSEDRDGGRRRRCRWGVEHHDRVSPVKFVSIPGATATRPHHVRCTGTVDPIDELLGKFPRADERFRLPECQRLPSCTGVSHVLRQSLGVTLALGRA